MIAAKFVNVLASERNTNWQGSFSMNINILGRITDITENYLQK